METIYDLFSILETVFLDYFLFQLNNKFKSLILNNKKEKHEKNTFTHSLVLRIFGSRQG